uniref:Uncharacterized protein n=1 Tax=Arundo donax TaxID=35708 RepID=A0A0A9FDF3_ARUDO
MLDECNNHMQDECNNHYHASYEIIIATTIGTLNA